MQNITFYCITCKDPLIEDCYVGSTNDLQKRVCDHAHICNYSGTCEKSIMKRNQKLYNFIRANGCLNNWEFNILTESFCYTRAERFEIEQLYIKLLQASLNSKNAYTTKNEVLQQKKSYNEKNRDKNNERNKIFREQHKDEINQKKKLYYEQHKAEIIQKKKLYKEQHRDEINKKQRERRALNKLIV